MGLGIKVKVSKGSREICTMLKEILTPMRYPSCQVGMFLELGNPFRNPF